MAIEVDPQIVDTWRASSGSLRVRFDGVNPDDAIDAAKAARAAVCGFPHPEEPEDPLASWVGPVEIVSGGAEFGFDAGDAGVYDGVFEALAAAMASAVEAEGVVAGRLTAPAVHTEAVEIPRYVRDSFVGDYPAGWYSALAVPEPYAVVFAESTTTDWELRVRVDLTPDEVVAFYERGLPAAGFHVTGAIEFADDEGAVASVYFERDRDAGCVVIYRFDGETSLGVEGYAARTPQDVLWNAIQQRQRLAPGARWRVQPNWP